MQKRIDAPEGRPRYGQPFATVEPAFGKPRFHRGLERFTRRGRTKVNAQWQVFWLVQNIEKLA